MIEQLKSGRISTEITPFYFYDLDVLDRTLDLIKNSIFQYPIHVHYAVKANYNRQILQCINRAGFGADCVSYGEVSAALDAGISPDKIVFAGVGKTDFEISSALKARIGCFNVESLEELDNIAAIAEQTGIIATVALRVNPNVDAHTHKYITTGLQENKFGIDLSLLDMAVHRASSSQWLYLSGLHFHIGSQITSMEPFERLTSAVNSIVGRYEDQGIHFSSINVGGGLGIDYSDPDKLPDFEAYFTTLINGVKLRDGQQLHCELGRSIVAQCGSLISRVVYVKNGVGKKFVILDAGMNCLIRPALYSAHHEIQNLTAMCESRKKEESYDVVGPICESSDVFALDEIMPETHRGDLVAIRSAGAYGESMASNYNIRPLQPAQYYRSDS